MINAFEGLVDDNGRYICSMVIKTMEYWSGSAVFLKNSRYANS